jgi:hypothetical protein
MSKTEISSAYTPVGSVRERKPSLHTTDHVDTRAINLRGRDSVKELFI